MFSNKLSVFLGTLYKKRGMTISYVDGYVDVHTVCKFICALHGEYSNKPYNVAHNGNSNGCPDCVSSNRRRSRRSKLLYGIGLNDWDGVVYISESHKIPEYRLWKDLLKRVYSKKYQKKSPNYVEVSVDSKWHSLKGFIEDVSKLKGYENAISGDWALDKDIITLGNKHYSFDTCCFVPPEINCNFRELNKDNGLPLGVYARKNGKYACDVRTEGKTIYLGSFSTPLEAYEVRKLEKKKIMSSLADKYEGVVDNRVIERLRNYDYGYDGNIKE